MASFTTLAGTKGKPGHTDNLVFEPHGIAQHPTNGDIYVSGDTSLKLIRGGVVTTVAGKAGEDPSFVLGKGADARFALCRGISISPHADSLLLCDCDNHCVFRAHLETLEVVLVCGVPGIVGGLDGPIATATFDSPVKAIETETGELFIVCASACTIRRVDTAGNVTTLCGQHGVGGKADGVGSAATLNRPFDIAYVAGSESGGSGGGGTLFVADAGNSCVRSVSTVDGTVTTLPGSFTQANGISAGTTPDGRLCLYVSDNSSLHCFVNDATAAGEDNWSQTTVCRWSAVGMGNGLHSCLSSDGTRIAVAFRGDHVVG